MRYYRYACLRYNGKGPDRERDRAAGDMTRHPGNEVRDREAGSR
ncbi:MULTISPECIES: hypothetical protein [Clostridia]|nr:MULTISPECIES: hypothetical protein [Clostridia]